MCLEALYGPEVLREAGGRSALVEVAVVLNAAWSAYCLRKDFHASFPALQVVFGAYDLVTRHVRLPISPPAEITEEEMGLFVPPDDVEGFRQLARRICGGKFVKNLVQRA
jgi:carbonic anhydrase